jgi:hypothetical protein
MMSSQNDSIVTNSSSDADLTQDFSTESNSSSTISKFNIPSYTRILVPHDGKETSDKALNHAIVSETRKIISNIRTPVLIIH